MFHCCPAHFYRLIAPRSYFAPREELTHLRVQKRTFRSLKRFFHFFFFFFLSFLERWKAASDFFLSLCLPCEQAGGRCFTVFYMDRKKASRVFGPYRLFAVGKRWNDEFNWKNLTDNGMFNIVNVVNARSSFLCIYFSSECLSKNRLIFREKSIGKEDISRENWEWFIV